MEAGDKVQVSHTDALGKISVWRGEIYQVDEPNQRAQVQIALGGVRIWFPFDRVKPL
jgi:hypothetical protein